MWEVMKEITGKCRNKSSKSPKILQTENGMVVDQKTIADNFNNYFVNVGP